MPTTLLSYNEIAFRANQLYATEIRDKVEIEENIGKMVIIDIETGEYEVSSMGLQAARNLSHRNSNAQLFGIRIGYEVAVSFGGSMERISR